jgi:hypothetical protein
MTECVPCQREGRPNVPAQRFIPCHGRDSMPMCEACWGGGIGPGLAYCQSKNQKPVVLPIKKPEEPAVPNKAVKLCACNCGKPAMAGREYAYGHKPPNGSFVPDVEQRQSASSSLDQIIADIRAKRDKLTEQLKVLEKLK